MLWLQEFDLEIRDRSGAQNLVADHLSRIERSTDDATASRDDFPDESLLTLSTSSSPWFANIVNYLAASIFPPLASRAQCDKLKSDARYYIWDDPYLWKMCNDQVTKRCISRMRGGFVTRVTVPTSRMSHFSETNVASRQDITNFHNKIKKIIIIRQLL